MDLYIKDRFYISEILPKNGKFMEFNLKRGIISKTSLTEEDKEKYSIVNNEETKEIKWDFNKDLENPLSVDFSKEEIDYMKKSCENLVDSDHPDDFWLTVEKIYDAVNE